MIGTIQILRFIAAILVVAFHGKISGIFPELNYFLDSILNYGYAGVDVFFVISGVIMAHTTKDIGNGIRPASAFFIVRFARVYTGWWPAMLLYVIYFKITNQLGTHINITESFFIYFTNPAGLINVAIWSLMFELYFYTLISLSILIKKQHRMFFMKLAFIVLIIVNIYFYMTRENSESISTHNWIQLFYIAPIVAEFFMGYFIYKSINKYKIISLQKLTLGLILLIIVIIATAENFSSQPYGLANYHYWPERTVLIGGAATAIVGIALKIQSPENIIYSTLAKLGNYSYSIYLLHTLVFNIILTSFLLSSYSNKEMVFVSTTSILLVVIASSAYFHFIEYPIYKYIRSNTMKIMNK